MIQKLTFTYISCCGFVLLLENMYLLSFQNCEKFFRNWHANLHFLGGEGGGVGGVTILNFFKKTFLHFGVGCATLKLG